MKRLIRFLLCLAALFPSLVSTVEAAEIPKSRQILEEAEESALEYFSDGLISVDKTETAAPSAYPLLPDFSNEEAWAASDSPYNTPLLWGQCTWFVWGRFYEIYGYNPGFAGNGYETAFELVNAHPDQFYLSAEAKAGAIFSTYNHTGLVIEAGEETITIQEGNLNSISNPWHIAIEDWRTVEMSWEQFASTFGNVTFANPYADIAFQA